MKRITLSILCAVALLWGAAWAAMAAEAQLIVQVTTNQSVYQAGETVEVEVRTFLNGEPVSAQLTAVALRVTLPDGRTVRSEVSDEFRTVGTGIYVSSGVARAPGAREVVALAKLQVGCNCNAKTLKSQGFASYAVEAAPLDVVLRTDQLAPSVCDTVEVKVSLSHPAWLQLMVVYPTGLNRPLVIPGWLDAGDHVITFSLKAFFDVGPVTILAVASDDYGQKGVSAVQLDVAYGVCDC